jgi:SAM-dependent methyltransferase
VVTVGELAPLLLAQELAYIEIPVDAEEYRRRSRYDAERSLAVAEVVAVGDPGRVLEIGVGYLNLVLTLRRVLGDTVELSGVEHPGRRYLDDATFQSEVGELKLDLRRCDIITDPFPFAEGSFDVVLFSEIIEHLSPAAVPDVLERLRGLVAPGGRIVVSSPNLGAFFRIASLAFGKGHVMDTPVDVAIHPGVYGHMRLYGRNDICLLAGAAGLRVSDWRWLNWDRGFIDRSTARGKVLYRGQAIASRVAQRWSGAWVCALEVA